MIKQIIKPEYRNYASFVKSQAQFWSITLQFHYQGDSLNELSKKN